MIRKLSKRIENKYTPSIDSSDSIEIAPSVWKIVGVWPSLTPTVPPNTALILQSVNGQIPEQNEVPRQARSLVELDELNLFISEINDVIQVSYLSIFFSIFVILFSLGISFYLWISVIPMVYNDFPLWLSGIIGLVCGLMLGGCSIKSYSFCLQLHLHKEIRELVQEYNDARKFVQDGEW